jgi:hypothetical protein
MRRLHTVCLTALLMLGTVQPLRADVMPPPPLWQRVAGADCVVIGRVLGIEDQDVTALQAPAATEKVAYRVAVVAVREDLFGAKGQKRLRVAWPLVQGRRRYGPVSLQAGQEVALVLTKHFQQPFYVVPSAFDVVVRQNGPAFDRQAAEARAAAGALKDPGKALTAGTPQERLLAASVLVLHYRTPRGSGLATEPIDARESKLILAALAEADWTRPANILQPSAVGLFARLGLTAQDGWTPPQVIRAPQDYAEAARAWIRRHGDTYRVRRFVAAAPRP